MLVLKISPTRYLTQFIRTPGDCIQRTGAAQPIRLTAAQQQAIQFWHQWHSGQTVFTFYTSGSTGTPKPILLHREQMALSAKLTGRALNLQPGDSALVCLATDYIAGTMMLVRGLELGLELTVIDPCRHPLAFFNEDTVFDFAAFVPLQLQTILNTTPEKRSLLNRMKAILIGGAAVNQELAAAIQSINAPVYHSYGMTETVSHIALRRLNGSHASDFFTPLDGVKLDIDVRGCLTIQSALTHHQILHTNDCVELKADGSFRWLGRIDHVINSGGVKVQPEKVEIVVADLLVNYQNGLLAKRRFFIGAMPHPELQQAVVMVIEGAPLDHSIQQDIRHLLQVSGRLTRYEIPRSFYYLPTFVETPTGKVNRVANLAALTAQLHSYPNS